MEGPLAPPPTREALVERQPLTMTATWQRWFARLWQDLTALGLRLTDVAPVLVPWTPTLVGSTGGSAHTYVVQWGQAVRSGHHVTFDARVQLSAKDGTMGGVVTIAGLPAPMAASANAFVPLLVACANVTMSGTYTSVFGGLLGGDQAVRLYEQGTGLGWNALPASTIGATTDLAVSGSYWSA